MNKYYLHVYYKLLQVDVCLHEQHLSAAFESSADLLKRGSLSWILSQAVLNQQLHARVPLRVDWWHESLVANLECDGHGIDIQVRLLAAHNLQALISY